VEGTKRRKYLEMSRQNAAKKKETMEANGGHHVLIHNGTPTVEK
jgi:hypothetical protein